MTAGEVLKRPDGEFLPFRSGGLRFAFYGRVSTEDQQDPEASRQWQLKRASSLVEPAGGVIVAHYFDIGQSRSIPWQRRPCANDLLAELRNPNRVFDAVVIGEPQRAFYGNQYGLTIELFKHFGVSLWVPEVGGAIDPVNEAHELIMSVFGGLSKGERNRIKIRVRTAMASIAQMEGRFLGGRPPYGYRLVDAGPHPNPAKAAEGRRLHKLARDAATAGNVSRIFEEFLNGQGIYAIAEGLTRDNLPSPSAYDRKRNRHRSGIGWSKSAVRAILLNPRYTGRQVWNKQRKDEILIDIDDVALGHTTKMSWNDSAEWIWSDTLTHEPLIRTEDFERAQALLAAKGKRAVVRRPRTGGHTYILRSLCHCDLCGRRMQGNWTNDAPYYRCRYPQEYALANKLDHPKSVQVREDDILEALDDWLASVFSPPRLENTITLLERSQGAGPGEDTTKIAARQILADCERKLRLHQAALEAGTDPKIVKQWTDEVLTRQASANAQLAAIGERPRRLTKKEISSMIHNLGDQVGGLRFAAPKRKAEIYRDLGLKLTYKPQERIVRAEMLLNADRMGKLSCPRGDLNPHAP
ncbi:recombinase family protein [Actinomadura sp. DC4]|uniref:recombinase family protein n=1 Tax=Actinomadura sp. DC4 TaxID=3055069 RepID=UPI0025B0E126|nr:recombinase family protein [Actinomadura sp. DC4]MDN3359274.1 recombinase family protein [Actinomadura sp. DC4]